MADDAVTRRTSHVDRRRYVRGTPNRVAAILLAILPGPNPALVSAPTAQYAWSASAPSVSASGSTLITVPAAAYNLTGTAPAVTSTSAPPDYVYASRVQRVNQQRSVRGGNTRNGIALAIQQPANGQVITVPTASYNFDPGALNAIGNHGFLYRGSDDGATYFGPPMWLRRWPARLLMLDAQNVFIPVQTVQYSIVDPVPAIQVSGSLSITVPAVQYNFNPQGLNAPTSILVPTVQYLLDPPVPTNINFTRTPCTVRAFRACYVDNRYRKFDEIFEIDSPFKYNPYCMAGVDAFPADWLPFLNVYVLAVDIATVRPLEGHEVVALIRDPAGPYRRS